MIKLSKAAETELKCLSGLCDHGPFDKSCAYIQMIDKPDPSTELYNRIARLIKTEVTKQNAKKKGSKRK